MSLPTWSEQLKALDGVADNLIAQWRPGGASEAETQDMNKLALSILAGGYLCRVYTDARRPVFMPLWNYAFNQGGPDPDYVYSTAEVDVDGVYEISGYRGTTRFVEITQQSFDIMSPADMSGGPVPSTHDLDELRLGDDGSFRVLLSAERPDGHTGDWWRLEPTTRRLLMRKCSCDWIREDDARVAINRLDDGGADMSPAETARRFSDLAAWVEGMIAFDMKLVRYYREHHGINTLLRSKKIDEMGGLPKQVYYDGIHEINDDEVLIIETEVPRQSRYWQALVADDRFCTVDWVNRQSSLNDAQARLDGDGKFRAVISRLDPGVPNWLDKADYPWGVIQLRWNHASDHPDPTIMKVPFAGIREHLPADTPQVTLAERAAQLRARREGAQLRRIW
ncbi:MULTISPECIES: DUF1214 domain-containing protein [unclassified Pseudofrankia]|uniref:DUF1214 domain-containing protein n=1 Tax=unclassified Pseudofrankia TaxID=2994372 RepID=UPI0008DA9D57|nr:MULTISPECIES: DUF1214 domain-containing protein [unclassified Pseudofrankia]MDT3445107.1 DUF1214 domain-containing protein [Pseudofrankia sp. BMG5.37]OHV47351.1 hypothetical protein BCD48_18465 [Pseudofrankia sp. BMG5.36]